MNIVKHLSLKCILFVVILLPNFYADDYISKPFTFLDFIAIVFVCSLFILYFNLYDRLENRLNPISLSIDILLLIVAIFIAIIFTGALTGEMQFS